MMNLFKQLLAADTTAVTPAEAQAKLGKEPKPVLLDVRQPAEFRAGHIPGAVLMPLDQLAQGIETLPRDREIVCVCRSGNRSGVAARQLRNAGFAALNLSGGMIAWSRAGLPVRTGNGR